LAETPENARILLVDDNPAILKLLGTLFAEEGVEVTAAGSVAAAKAKLAQLNWQVDLVLSDISMPVETGFDLLEWLKRPDSPGRELPVLLTTAQLPEAENRIKGLAMGAVDYVVRPVELSELVLRARHAIAHFRHVRSLETSLQSSADLALVGRLLAASHHEIKNLAGLVRLSAQRTIKSATPEALQALDRSTELLVDVARSVNSLLSPEAAACTALDLLPLVSETAVMMRTRVNPCLVLPPAAVGPLWASAHAVRVQQIVINMMLNAADAINELDPVEGGQIEVSLTADGEWRRIRVKDNGIGFATPGVRHEFPAFATTKKLRGGQGLGLWLCATLAKNMGGELTLGSAGPGRGAEAVLSLRAAQPAEAPIDLTQYLVDDL
jgi:signal transduction histidine kinase